MPRMSNVIAGDGDVDVALVARDACTPPSRTARAGGRSPAGRTAARRARHAERGHADERERTHGRRSSSSRAKRTSVSSAISGTATPTRRSARARRPARRARRTAIASVSPKKPATTSRLARRVRASARSRVPVTATARARPPAARSPALPRVRSPAPVACVSTGPPREQRRQRDEHRAPRADQRQPLAHEHRGGDQQRRRTAAGPCSAARSSGSRISSTPAQAQQLRPRCRPASRTAASASRITLRARTAQRTPIAPANDATAEHAARGRRTALGSVPSATSSSTSADVRARRLQRHEVRARRGRRVATHSGSGERGRQHRRRPSATRSSELRCTTSVVVLDPDHERCAGAAIRAPRSSTARALEPPAAACRQRAAPRRRGVRRTGRASGRLDGRRRSGRTRPRADEPPRRQDRRRDGGDDSSAGPGSKRAAGTARRSRGRSTERAARCRYYPGAPAVALGRNRRIPEVRNARPEDPRTECQGPRALRGAARPGREQGEGRAGSPTARPRRPVARAARRPRTRTGARTISRSGRPRSGSRGARRWTRAS